MNREDVSPFYHLIGGYNCKIQEFEMSQNLVAPVAWMLAIRKHKPSMVIEIGTDKGGLSSLLSSVIQTYGGEFHTMDIKSGGTTCMYPLHGNSTFHQWDCFEHVDEIKALIQRKGLCFLLCDGGDKPKEFNLFSDLMKSGDVIACHDWCGPDSAQFSPEFWGWSEVPNERIDASIKGNKLIDFIPEWFEFSAWCVKQKT
jgi:hypothetical protein